MDFKSMHYANAPLIICNVWDAASANLAEKLGFAAIGTSSAACAASLGYEDGEEMTFEELLVIVKQIRKATKLPLSVDMEGGYSENIKEVLDNLEQLTELDVVSINIEDSKVKEGRRSLIDATIFAEVVSAIKKHLGQQLFINVRTDTFLVDNVGDQLESTISRAEKYQEAGADGIFVPGIALEDDISSLCSTLHLPVNVMAWEGLPDFEKLGQLGVKRISMGNFLYHAGMKHIEQKLVAIKEEQSFNTNLSSIKKLASCRKIKTYFFKKS